VQVKPRVHPGECLAEPGADEPGAAGDEDALAAQRFPTVARVLEEFVEIARERVV